MLNDTVSDFLIQVKNAYLARHKTVEVPYSKMIEGIAKILQKDKFIEGVKVKVEKGRQKTLLIDLLYRNRKPALSDIVRVSKPGLRVYVSKKRIPIVYGGLGTVILSTPKGLMTAREATRLGLGGEVICKIW